MGNPDSPTTHTVVLLTLACIHTVHTTKARKTAPGQIPGIRANRRLTAYYTGRIIRCPKCLTNLTITQATVLAHKSEPVTGKPSRPTSQPTAPVTVAYSTPIHQEKSCLTGTILTASLNEAITAQAPTLEQLNRKLSERAAEKLRDGSLTMPQPLTSWTAQLEILIPMQGPDNLRKHATTGEPDAESTKA